MKKLICWNKYDGGFWFRILDHGLSIVNRKKHPPLFSERMGLVRVLRIGDYSVKRCR